MSNILQQTRRQLEAEFCQSTTKAYIVGIIILVIILVIKCFVHLDSFLKPFFVSVVEATETNAKVDLNIYGRKKEHLYLNKGHLCQPFPLRLCNKILAKHISQFLHLASNQCLSSTNLSGKQERSRRRDIS